MSKVYVVFCMDTEGPCDDPTNSSLLKTWAEVDSAMDKLFQEEFRERNLDFAGQGLKIGWFFLTWTGFIDNPRNRDFGYHKIRDHYINRWGELMNNYGDEHCWHYHHPSKEKIGNVWGFDWLDNNEYENIISRQILDRQWFPTCYRSGGTIHTKESSQWVDNWFPFDYSNRAPIKIDNIIDWSKGNTSWYPYNPDIYDFTKKGFGKRQMVRTLDLVTGAYSIDSNEIRKAFEEAQKGRDSILSVFDHDYRDIANRVDSFIQKVKTISKEFPETIWEFSTPSEAVIKTIKYEKHPKSINVEAAIYKNKLRIWTTSPIFQNMPWIALENKNKKIYHITEAIKDSPISWEVDLSNYPDFLRIGIGVSTINGLSDTIIIKRSDNIFGSFFRKKIIQHPIFPNSINEHSKLYPKLCIDRVTKVLPEMDSIKQLRSILVKRKLYNNTLLDVECASGQVYNSIKNLGIEYYGISSYQRAIQIGKLILDYDKSKFRNMSLSQISTKEKYDIVVNLYEFRYVPQFEKTLEIMARLANKYLIIRAPSFGKKDKINYLPDVLLENGFQTIRTYFNIFSKNRIEHFLKQEGFKVEWVEDIRQKERFNSKPETVGGIEFNYEFLVAKRIKERPSKREILGEYWAYHADRWVNGGEGVPKEL